MLITLCWPVLHKPEGQTFRTISSKKWLGVSPPAKPSACPVSRSGGISLFSGKSPAKVSNILTVCSEHYLQLYRRMHMSLFRPMD